jgi:hypothetical protein
VVEHLSTTTQDPALGGSISPWASIRGANGIDAERPDERHDGRAEDGVPVENELLRRCVVWKRLTELLDDPGRRRIESAVEVNNVSPAMLDPGSSVF